MTYQELQSQFYSDVRSVGFYLIAFIISLVVYQVLLETLKKKKVRRVIAFILLIIPFLVIEGLEQLAHK
ncbi:TPA: hypothetical protein TZW92_001808 [Streptococcus suis]|uniref:hypothetical protein n=1 Tax=Streptococcus suis TaxID=1307 RepID=UPI002A79465B|nr:hypothetical protein [Streptococcus suis]HEM4766591.1 hypothetical protein [Streptococcus suis]